MQSKLLISTKFVPPRISAAHVARSGLLHQLARLPQRTLALITGSAGYGKTTLLTQWREACLQSGAVVAWLSLSPDDKGFADFCAVLFEALKRLGITVDFDMLADGSSEASIDAVVASVAQGAADRPKDLFLILDDYHHVEDPWASKLMQKLLDRCPANLHLVIASRAAPALNLSRLRGKNLVVDIDCSELPFSPAETRSFIEGNLEPGKISADDIGLVHELTGGWPSCLQLAAIMLKTRPGSSSRLRDLVWRSNDLQTYLSEEVMAGLPAELAEFVETLSLFRRFNAPLAECVTGNPSATEFLRRMELENLPLQRVDSDDKLPWFRFHPLFGEFLDTRMERRGPAAIAQLHAKASRWFAANDLLVEAVRHANLAGDIELAAAVIEGVAPATWTLSYLGPTMHLLERLSQETLLAHRRLFLLACVTVALTARAPVAAARVAQLERSETARHPEVAPYLPLVHAVIALQQDNTQQTIDLLEAGFSKAKGNAFLNYLALSALATAYAASGRCADARALLDRHPIAPSDKNNDMAIIAESARVLSLLVEGDIREAERLASPLLAHALKTFGRRSTCTNVFAAFAADAYYELNRIDDARETIANRHGLLESSGIEVTVRASLCRSRLDLLQEGPDTALAFLQQQIARFRRLGLDRPLALMLAEQVNVLLVKNDQKGAATAFAALDALADQHRESAGFLAEIPIAAALTRARMLTADQAEQALHSLDEAKSRALALNRGKTLALIELLAARTLDDLGRKEEAGARRAQAIERGCRSGLVRTFVDEGVLAHRELSRFIQQGPKDAATLAYAREVLAAFPEHTVQDGGPPVTTRSRAAPGQVTLTRREIEILALVAQAMSNKRIALTLNVTLETVKWNLRNIFAKLGVSSRYDAMIWARNQNLIR
jgi:LuxR family maltose regulon positive regulatory protein